MKHRNDQKVAVAWLSAGKPEFRFMRSMLDLWAFDTIGGRTPDGTKMGGRFRILKGGAHLPVLSGAQITKGRNKHVREFLAINADRREDEKVDWLLILDDDMTFEPDLLERLIGEAHPVERPIVGGLCFAFMLDNARKFWPTLYAYEQGSERLRRLTMYPDDSLIQIAATGAACLLVHRTVLEKMAERYPPPWPWFAETPFYERGEDGKPILETGDAYSEDITFCLRAQACGFPIYVHTGIKLGHVKTFEADEEAFIAESMALREAMRPALPTYVVIPVKAGEREEMTARLVDTLAEQIQREHIYVDDTDRTITEKWTAGWMAASVANNNPYNVAFLNNDLEVPLEFLARLEAGLRCDDDNWIAYPNHRALDIPNGAAVELENPHMAGQTMSGYAFMVRGEAEFWFDPQFRWWYSDSDLEKQARATGKHVVCVGGCFVNHLHPMESSRSPELLAVAKEDEARFAAKWGLDPESLWLAQHPEFGAEVSV